MPELPEVEALRRGLLPLIVGQKIKKAEVKMPKLVSSKGTTRVSSDLKLQEFIQGTLGRTIEGIERRAKNLIFSLNDGGIILVHLKMTGQLVYKGKSGTDKQISVSGGHPIELSENSLPNKHTYVIFNLEHGTLYYNDVRQFGYLLYFTDKKTLESQKHFDGLGAEPLDKGFDFELFYEKLKAKSGILKKVFLDQTVVVGLGNIYADEVCFDAMVKPLRSINSLKKSEIKALYESIVKILPKAVAMGGSSVSNYLLADGSKGNYAREHKVYGRAGQVCLRCGKTLQKTVLGGRTTVFCDNCQK
ncbi:MAG: DNA-formamidopyrimidine glycosylase [bacterium]